MEKNARIRGIKKKTRKRKKRQYEWNKSLVLKEVVLNNLTINDTSELAILSLKKEAGVLINL